MFDGKAYGEGIVEIVKGYVERELAPIKAENDSLKARIAELEARPLPEKGEKGDPGEAGKDGRDGADGLAGKDAAGIVQALKDSGELVLTLSDGNLIRTGIRDGEKGLDGQNGKDGIDLTSFDAIVLDDDRTIELKFAAGDEERVASFKWPTQLYRGVFKEGQEYDRGDTVTWGGCQWHCDEPTKDKPEKGPWTKCVNKGRDGKDARG